MARREVVKTGKDSEGDITKLCNSGTIWSPRSKSNAISDIESNTHEYYVSWGSKTTDIKVVSGKNGKYLRTDKDSSTTNNLDELPDC